MKKKEVELYFIVGNNISSIQEKIFKFESARITSNQRNNFIVCAEKEVVNDELYKQIYYVVIPISELGNAPNELNRIKLLTCNGMPIKDIASAIFVEKEFWDSLKTSTEMALIKDLIGATIHSCQISSDYIFFSRNGVI